MNLIDKTDQYDVHKDILRQGSITGGLAGVGNVATSGYAQTMGGYVFPQNPQSGSCPSCGRCRCCGNPGYSPQPHYYQPYWQGLASGSLTGVTTNTARMESVQQWLAAQAAGDGQKGR